MDSFAIGQERERALERASYVSTLYVRQQCACEILLQRSDCCVFLKICVSLISIPRKPHS